MIMVADFQKFLISPGFLLKVLGKVTEFQSVRSKALTLIYMLGGGGGANLPPHSFLLQLKNGWR